MRATAITVIHKFIRRELFEVSQQLFRAGPADIAAVRAAVEEVAALLESHAAQEDAQIEPQLRRVDPALADRMMEDHKRLEADMEALRRAARAIDPGEPWCADALLQLHLDWSRFVAAYLVHLDDEERTICPVLGDQAPPLTVIARSAASQPAAQREAFLGKLWKVVAPRERAVLEHAVGSALARTA